MEAPGLPDMHGFSSSFFLWLQLHCTSEITPAFPLGEVRDEFQVINIEGKQYSFSVIVLKNVKLKWKKRSNGIFKLHTIISWHISPGRGRASLAVCIWLGNPRNAKASVLVQAHPCLYRTTLIWFQLPCLETRLTNPSTSVFVLLLSFPVLILMLGSFSLRTFHPRMPIPSPICWLPTQAHPCPTGCSTIETPPLMRLGQRLSCRHSSRPISQKHFTKQPARNDEAAGAVEHPTALLPFCTGSNEWAHV